MFLWALVQPLAPLVLAAVLLLAERAVAFPGGAGGCAGGMAAVGGFHLDDSRPIETGPLSDFGLELSINGEVVSSGTTIDLERDQDHVALLTATGDMFRGFLFRLEAPSSSISVDLVPASPNGQAAGVCASPALGVTHLDRDLKTNAAATFNVFEAADGVTLDVTVVVANDQVSSIYYYTGFTINIVQGAAPTAAPTSDLCDNCRRWYNAIRRRTPDPQDTATCQQKCRRIPRSGSQFFVPNHAQYCAGSQGLCTALRLGHSARRACRRRTPFCPLE